MKTNIVAIDLFSGCGGMSLGAHKAGIDVKVAIENDLNAAATFRLNFPKVALFDKDIQKFKDFPKKPRKAISIAFGGPPCQGFSTSNQKTRSSKNPTNWLFLEFLRVIGVWQPDWVVFENVKGIIETEQGHFFDEVVDRLSKLRYTTSSFVLNSIHFGVPQKRNRVFIIGSREGIAIEMPTPMKFKSLTVGDAISDLPRLPNGANTSILPYRSSPLNKYQTLCRGGLGKCGNHLATKNAAHILKRYKHIPQGGNWEDIPKRLMNNYADSSRCHTGIYHRLSLDAPSVVIGNYRKNMLIHPLEDRGLSVREAARLQSFPDSFEFTGSIGFQQQQVGNAVPPLLAHAIFEAIVAKVK